MSIATLADADQMFASFDIEELEVLEVSDSVALPEMGASSSTLVTAEASTEAISLCCSSSSSTCCSC